MATTYFFDNKQVTLPGAYSTIKSASNTPIITANYGRVLVIDNGQGAGFGGGSGITGDLASGADSVYRFQDLASYQAFLKGGIFWKAAEALFKPQAGRNGVSEVIHVKAATTTKATMTFTATGGGAAGGSFKVNPRDEGVIANGVQTGSGSSAHLDKGYGYTIETGVRDNTKFIFKIWLGAWKGDYTDSIAYDEIDKADTVAQLVVASPEFNNIQELIDWGTNDSKFNAYFKLDATSAVVGAGTVDSDDISGLSGYQLASGATETYATTDLDTVLETVQEVDYAILLSDQYGSSNYDSAYSSKMFIHLRDEAKFMKFMFVGGGADEDEFTATDGSVDIAEYFDNIHVIVAHSNVKKRSQRGSDGFRYWNTLIHAAYQVGRMAGLEPQVPLTNKAIDVDGMVHNLTKAQKELAVQSGISITAYNEYTRSFNVVQSVNTIQNNTYQINADATSFSTQIMRIVSQINRELVINANSTLLAEERGVNVNTLGSGTLLNWTKDYLQSRIATEGDDNLLLSYSDVTVTKDQDSYFVNYKIEVNGEITKIFFTGFLLN